MDYELKIKDILVNFYRSARDGDYMESLTKAIYEVSKVSEDEFKKEPLPTENDTDNLLRTCGNCLIPFSSTPLNWCQWTTDKWGTINVSYTEGQVGYLCNVCLNKLGHNKKD